MVDYDQIASWQNSLAGLICLKWIANSCWLDAVLQLFSPSIDWEKAKKRSFDNRYKRSRTLSNIYNIMIDLSITQSLVQPILNRRGKVIKNAVVPKLAKMDRVKNLRLDMEHKMIWVHGEQQDAMEAWTEIRTMLSVHPGVLDSFMVIVVKHKEILQEGVYVMQPEPVSEQYQDLYLNFDGSTLQQCLDSYFGVQRLDIIDQRYTWSVGRTSKNLSLWMKLFDNENRKIRCPRFSFDVELTLGGIIFDLQGVVVHTGRSTTTGHYITYRRRKFGASKWYLFDDVEDCVVEVKLSDVLNEGSNAYGFLYSKKVVATLPQIPFDVTMDGARSSATMPSTVELHVDNDEILSLTADTVVVSTAATVLDTPLMGINHPTPRRSLRITTVSSGSTTKNGNFVLHI